MSKFENEPKWVRFVTGGLASCTAETFTLPIDTIKVRPNPSAPSHGSIHLHASLCGPQVRLQVQTNAQYGGVVDCARQVVRQEGFTSLWKGLSPALARQGSYSGIRMVCAATILPHLCT